jgi:hypothetical protein
VFTAAPVAAGVSGVEGPFPDGTAEAGVCPASDDGPIANIASRTIVLKRSALRCNLNKKP